MKVKNYCSTTSIISRPLYFPQCGQTRCGSFGSWQFGHCDRLALDSESWVRRAEVLRLECRRLGFGIKIYSRTPAPGFFAPGCWLLAPSN
jgi:hypothetical protein